MKYRRLPIEKESPEEFGYGNIACNLSESSVHDMSFSAFDYEFTGQKFEYGNHRGHPEFRALIAKEAGVKPEHVLLTPGAAAALFIINTSMLGKKDRTLVLAPNYSTNRETPRLIQCTSHWFELSARQGFKMDLDKLKLELQKGYELLSLTFPHNPTGAMITAEELKRIIAWLEELDMHLLMDETYGDMVFGNRLPVAAGLSDKVISVSSLSKSFGLPGLRMGWIICKDEALMETFLAAKEHIYICGSAMDEYLGFQFYQNKDAHFAPVQEKILAQKNMLKEWVESSDIFTWSEPQGGCVAFLSFIEPEKYDLEKFYKVLVTDLSTYVGPGHWFEMPNSFFRVGYAYPDKEELMQGLENLHTAANRCLASFCNHGASR